MHGAPQAENWIDDGATRPPMMADDDRTMPPTCAGCERRIGDQYLLRVAPDLEWHATCLKCVDCGQPLDETCTCFVRDGKTYCRQDYVSRFTAKCAACSVPFQRSDLVMRARHLIYHVDCFRCAVCERPLTPGDQFALTTDDRICCRDDLDSEVTSAGSYDVTAAAAVAGKCDSTSNTTEDEVMTSPGVRQLNNNNENETRTTVNNVPEADNASGCVGQSSNQNSSSSSGGGSGSTATKHGGRSRSHKGSDQKTTRIRTVLNEKQLHTLRTCYGANPRPDALMKEQLVEMTGLSPRVIRVWFQNKRCKDKKRSILLKQIHQHHQEAQAVSMVATSPVSHEPQSNMAPVKVQQFQLLPWSAFIQGGGGNDPLTGAAGTCPMVPDYGSLPLDADVQPPPFQRLLSSFGHLSDDDEDDTIVSVDEPNGRALAAARQHRTVGYMNGVGTAVDGRLARGVTTSFPGTATQHGIIC